MRVIGRRVNTSDKQFKRIGQKHLSMLIKYSFFYILFNIRPSFMNRLNSANYLLNFQAKKLIIITLQDHRTFILPEGHW